MEPLVKPAVVFSASNEGGQYLMKLQQLAAAVDTAFDAFNLQLAAAETAEQIRDATATIKSQVQAIQSEINEALTAAYAAIGTAGDTATYARQFLTSRKIGQKDFNGTEDIELDVGDVSGLAAHLTEVEMFSLGGTML